MEFVQFLKQNDFVIDDQFINTLSQYLNSQQEHLFDQFLQLIPVIPVIDTLILPLQNALKFYAKLSSFHIQQLQESIIAIPIFIFALQLALQSGTTQKLRQQRTAAQQLVNQLINAQTAISFATALFNVFQLPKASISITHLTYLFENNFPQSLLTQIFTQLIQIQPDFAGDLLQQVKIQTINYEQFINVNNYSLRLAAVNNCQSNIILERQNDTQYQIRVQVLNKLPSITQDCSLLEKLQLIGYKIQDKNVYVRKAAYNAVQNVITLNNTFKVLDQQMFEQLKEKQQHNVQQEVLDVFDNIIKAIEQLDQILAYSLKRLTQMQISELEAFLKCLQCLIKYKHQKSQASFKTIILNLLSSKSSDQIKKIILQFVEQFIFQLDDAPEETNDENDINTKKQQSQSILNKLLDIYIIVGNKDQCLKIFSKLASNSDSKRFQQLTNQQLVFKQLVGIVSNEQLSLLVRTQASELFQILYQFSQEDLEIRVGNLIPVIIQNIELITNQQQNQKQLQLIYEKEMQLNTSQQLSQHQLLFQIYSFEESLSKLLYNQLKLQNSQQDKILKDNVESLRKFILSNPQVFYQYQQPLNQFIKCIFHENKSYIDQLFGMLSRRAKNIKQQTFYVSYCCQLLITLSEQLNSNNGDKNNNQSVQQILSTAQNNQEETTFLQEYSYLVYSCVIAVQYIEQLSTDFNQFNTQLLNILIKSFCTICMVFPRDLLVGNKLFGDFSVQVIQQFISNIHDECAAQQKQDQNKISIQLQNLVQTSVISVQSLVFNKPSEYNQLILTMSQQLLGFNEQIDNLIVLKVSQLFNASCIKIQQYLKNLFKISKQNETCRAFFGNLDVKIIKQYYKELQQDQDGDQLLLQEIMNQAQQQDLQGDDNQAVEQNVE